MRVGVLGINHKLADLKLRELLAKACQKRFLTYDTIHGEHTFVLLSTCNRTEIYFTSQDLPMTHSYLLGILRDEVNEEFDHKLYSYFGIDCFSHLTRVTAGLDSAIVAETEIQGQVKSAYEVTKAKCHLPHELHFLFQKSLKIGKKIRTQLPMSRGMPDLEDALWHIGSHFFKAPEMSRILFVGASAINRRILYWLKDKGISQLTLCNRSLESAQKISKEKDVAILEWEKLSTWKNYDWIIFGTKSPDYLLSKDCLSESFDRKLVIDLSVPRNVDPFLAKDSRMTLLNIDQINRTLKIRKQRMTHLLDWAEELVSDAVSRNFSLFSTKEINRHYYLAMGA